VHQHQARVEHVQVSVQVRPGIGIALGQLPFLRLARILALPDARRVTLVGKKGRVGIDQVDAACVFWQERLHGSQVVAQDEVIGGGRVRVAGTLGV
jgi:hypothetical protein